MPATYEAHFRIRHYECDAYGHVNNAHYLRYLQEAAYQASAAVGYDMVGYHSLGSYWFIRQTELEYLRPLRYGDAIVVRTWVEDFHRVRSIRAYEVRIVGSQDLVARGWSDWVYLDAVSGRPRSTPPDMIKAFLPNPAERVGRPRRRFLSAPPAPPDVFTLRRRVEWRDLDPIQHVNNAVYLSFMEDAAMQCSRSYGWPMARLQQEGFGILLRRIEVDYRQPAVLDDNLEIETWISQFSQASARRHFHIYRPDPARAGERELLCQAHALYVWFDLAANKLIRVPKNFLQDFAANCTPALSASTHERGES